MVCVFILIYFVFERNSRELTPGGLYLERLIIESFSAFGIWGTYNEEVYFRDFKVAFEDLKQLEEGEGSMRQPTKH